MVPNSIKMSIGSRVHYLDLATGALLNEALDEIVLTRIPAKLLDLFLAKPRVLLSIDDFLREVWDGRIVDEATVTRTINGLAAKLGDKASTDKYVENLHGRGYRFIGAIERPDAAEAGTAIGAPPPDQPERYRSLRMLGRLGEVIDTVAGIGVVDRLRSEFSSIEQDCQAALAAGDRAAITDVVDTLIELIAIAGLPAGSLRAVADACRDEGDWLNQAKCLTALGADSLARGAERKIAEQLHRQALALFAKVDDEHGQANCALGLGDVDFHGGYHKTARRHYEQAYRWFVSVGDDKGAGYAKFGLGSLAIARKDLKAADDLYMEASDHIDRVASLSAHAIMAERFAFLRMARSEILTIDTVSEDLIKSAIDRFRKAGNILGEADCLESLGHWLPSEDNRRAGFCRRALRLYQQADHAKHVRHLERFIDKVEIRQARLSPEKASQADDGG